VNSGGTGGPVRFGSFCLDLPRRQLARGAEAVHLTPKAFDLLALLIGEAPRVLTKTELHERLWPGTFVSDATLVSLVKELRRALEDRDPHRPIIRTVHRVGYAFCSHTEIAPPNAPRISHWLVVQGRRVALELGETVIGRDPLSTVCLDSAGVSRRHARIVVEEARVLLEDLGSKNGTMLGDARVSQAVLQDGDSIHLGPVLLVYRTSQSGISTETQMRASDAQQ
jgi:DNA-binding winged helix-turn-helix (wHTH) protein